MRNPPAGAEVLFRCNMLYQPLKNYVIQLDLKETKDIDAQNGAVLIPNPNSKIFLHWLTDNGNIRSTYTMTYATRVEGKLKIINGSATATAVHVVQLA